MLFCIKICRNMQKYATHTHRDTVYIHISLTFHGCSFDAQVYYRFTFYIPICRCLEVQRVWHHGWSAISTARPPRGRNLVEKWPLGTVRVLPTMVRNNTCGFNCCALLCLNQTWGFKQQTSVRLDQSEW